MLTSQIKATLLDSMGSDLTVVNAARVSFGKKHDVFDKQKDAKLIKYLASHGHISPFGHCFVSFHVKAPIFIARQLCKHKFMRWNEISRRYVKNTPEFYVPKWRKSTDDKKQGSGGTMEPFGASRAHAYSIHSNEIALNSYQNLLDEGVSEEQARVVLPASLMTEWIWSGSLDAFADMVKLRDKDDTQEETRQVAKQISSQMEELFPVSWVELTKG